MAVRRKVTHSEGTALERTFATLLKQLGRDLPEPVTEYAFAPGRKFRFDFAWLPQRVAVECEGIDHRLPDRYARDEEKYNLAVSLGWRLLRTTTGSLARDPAAFFETLRGLLAGKGAGENAESDEPGGVSPPD